MLAAGQALGGPSPIVKRDVPVPVTTVTSEQLEKLPANRDFRTILNVHNQLRGEVGARPLRWNPALAEHAQQYANILAETGKAQHSSRVGRENERENIVVGRPSGISQIQMVQIWVNERRFFRPGTFPDVCSGDWSQCGHYTQMIWPTTTDLGCGYARGRFDAFVCRYSPPGNRDGVAIGPQPTLPTQELAGGLCTSPRGVTIPCQNAPGGTPAGDGGGITDDGGGDKDSGVKEEVACLVDVNVHKPISVAPDEPVIEDAKEITPGATTLRNDDSDWRLGGEAPAGELPIMSLPTDLDRMSNPQENDLVKVIALNPNRLPQVYLFAFPIDVEADHTLKTEVEPDRTGEHANEQELGYFSAAIKARPTYDLPLLVPMISTLWVEGKLGGRYRMVIGKLVEGVAPGEVRYDRVAGQAYVGPKENRKDPFVCKDQATVTAAVVDIFQKNADDHSLRLTAFDVYWGGRPHFRAKVWPGGNAFRWGDPYKLGAREFEMPGPAVSGEVASMDNDDEDVAGDRWAAVNGPRVKINDTADGGANSKGEIEGGFLMRKENVAPVPGDRANRYPNRVSVGYSVNGEDLVRAEYLEVILPQVEPPGPRSVRGTPTGVSSDVQYTIEDIFDRDIKARTVNDYLHLYGAGIKAWEALMLGRNIAGDPLQERGRKNDFLDLVNVGVTVKGKALKPIRFGTAQRSQAEVHANRMIDGEFTDTLRLDLIGPKADKPLYDRNHRDYLWMAWSGLVQRRPDDSFDPAATRAAKERRRQEARKRQDKIEGRQDVSAEDTQRSAQGQVLTIPQDVILQLRAGTDRHDLMVFQGNRITLLPPYFFTEPGFPGYNEHRPDSPLNKVFYYNIDFVPGAPVSQFVLQNHQRPRP